MWALGVCLEEQKYACVKNAAFGWETGVPNPSPNTTSMQVHETYEIKSHTEMSGHSATFFVASGAAIAPFI